MQYIRLDLFLFIMLYYDKEKTADSIFGRKKHPLIYWQLFIAIL